MARKVGKLSLGITSADLLPCRPVPGPPPEWTPVNAPKQPQCGPNLLDNQAPKRHSARQAPLWAHRRFEFDVAPQLAWGLRYASFGLRNRRLQVRPLRGELPKKARIAQS